jgi:hypothetical protein
MLQKRIFYFAALIIFSRLTSFAQVNLQTGSAVFSLPIFNWQDDKSRLNSTIALSYSSGNGLKVNDVASNIGQGWNMVAGGVITRMQVGEPDDQPAFPGAYSKSDQDLTKYPAGYLYGGTPAVQGAPSAMTFYPTYGSQNILYANHDTTDQDRQMDYFSFQFNGKTGMFVLDTTGGDHGVPLGSTKMKISFQRDPTLITHGIRTTITSFTITDVDGVIYKFTKHGLTKVLKIHFCDKTGNFRANTPTMGTGNAYFQNGFDDGPSASPWYNSVMANPYVISNWYLSEIDDPLVTTRKITLTYDSLNLTNFGGQTISYNHSLNQYVIVSYRKSIITTQEIASINYPDSHKVSFTYSTTPRFDYPGEFALAKIDIQYFSRYLAEYQLNNSYFVLNRYGNPTTTYQQYAARLCLLSVKKLSVDLKEDAPPYTFDYYTGSNNYDDFVPPSFFYAKDIWGYYNGNYNLKSNSPLTGDTVAVKLNLMPGTLDYYSLKGLCFMNQNIPNDGINYVTKPGYAKNGLLKTITYPTGGSITYQYAQNTGTFIGSSTVQNLGGVNVSQTSSSDNYSTPCSTPVVTNYNYVMNGAGSASSMWGFETPNNSDTSTNSWQEEKKTLHWHWYNPIPTCLWHFVYPGILSQYETVSLDDLQKIMVAIAPALGILSTISTINDIAAVLSTSGFFEWLAIALDVVGAILGFVFTCPYQSKYTPDIIFYDFDLNQSAPLPAQFKRVEITESSGSIGKTVETFTQGDITDPGGADYPLWYLNTATGLPLPNVAYAAKQRFAPWAYGLPKLISVYDVNGNKIKETQNVYNFNYAMAEIYGGEPCICTKCEYTLTPLASTKTLVINSYSKRSDVWSNITWYNSPTSYITAPGNNDMHVDTYNMYTGRVLLTNTYERIYRTTDVTKFVQTESDFFYDSTYALIDYSTQCNSNSYDVNEIITYQSNGDVDYKFIKYPFDYNTGILDTLVTKNILSIPVSTNTYVVKSGMPNYSYNELYLNEKVTEFAKTANGNIKPYRVIEQRFATPTTGITLYSGPTTTVYTPYHVPQQFTYDPNSNLTGIKDEGSRVITNVYDLNDKYIVATAINADPVLDTVAYSSFQSHDLSRSGWALTGTYTCAYNANAPTGDTTFTLAASSANYLTATVPSSSKNYTLSYWASSTAVSAYLNGSFVAATKTGPTYNGFTYYEYTLNTLVTSVIVKNMTATAVSIDELRLYPSTARIRTTTYDPLIGKTSECDENNRITYYTYDNMARMRFIEDENRNVVKMFEYNNISPGKTMACPTTYYNHLANEVFTRSNCSAGYLGDTVIFALPANTVSSTKSQFDADMQAEINILTNGPSFANTNGTCAIIYYNTVQSQTDSTQGCALGTKGAYITYTVPANTYSSIISQSDANQQALNDIAANALIFANMPPNASCVTDTAAYWDWYPGDSVTAPDPSYCLSVNGQLPPHKFLMFTDLNPNSPTYNQKMAVDSGVSVSCPANTYFSNTESGNYTRNNCGTGYVGSTVTYTVPPGKYSSTTSQAAADNQAISDVTTNGQSYANTNGTCTPLENVNYTNTHSNQFSVRFTNLTTNVIYNFTANANVSVSTSMGQVPSGTYTVYICPINNYTAGNYSVQGIIQTGVVCATFNNISVTNTAAVLKFY